MKHLEAPEGFGHSITSIHSRYDKEYDNISFPRILEQLFVPVKFGLNGLDETVEAAFE